MFFYVHVIVHALNVLCAINVPFLAHYNISVHFFTDSPSIGSVSKGGGPQGSSENHTKFFILFADLPQMWHFADLWAEHFFAICGFADQLFVADLKLPQIRK
jgi:hypothetical protein